MKNSNKNPGMGKIVIIIALVFSLIGGIIGSAITTYKLLPQTESKTTNSDSNITISAKDNMTVASAVAKKSMSSVVGITTKGLQQSFLDKLRSKVLVLV